MDAWRKETSAIARPGGCWDDPGMKRILIVGATGGTGRHVVELLRKRGDVELRILARDVALARDLFGDGDIVCADVTCGDLAPAMDGVDAVISTLGSRDFENDGLRRVDLEGTVRLVKAAREAEVERFVLCSTIGAVPTPGVPEHLIRAFAPKGEAEAVVRNSGLAWTIIRPGRLTDEPCEDSRSIERKQVAAALVESLSRLKTVNAVYEINQARLGMEGADAVLGLQVE